MEFLVLFDEANTAECYERTESVVPQQALALANSSLTIEMARRVARNLPRDGDFIAAAFDRVLCRPPTDLERDECSKFLRDTDRSREMFVHVLFNHHDFVTIR
jgi:hypothetical protein